MGRDKRKRKNKAADVVARFIRPTEAREAHNDFQSAGPAVRVVPVIDTLLKQKRLSQAEYDALNHYRTQAHQAEDDIAQSGTLDPQRMMGGGGCFSGAGKIPAHLLRWSPAIEECGRLERELGSLLDIARAVAVEDVTLTRWAIQQGGGIEAKRSGRADIVPVDAAAEELAVMELRFAAGRIRR